MRNDLEQYDRLADEWWKEGGVFLALQQLNPPRFEYFDRHVQGWDRLNSLEVGCGGGLCCEVLAKRGARVCGIDLSRKSLEAAREHAKGSGLVIDYREGAAEAIPFPDRSFDVVLCVDVLEHVADLSRVVSEAFRVLKPGGTFLFDTINRTWRSKAVMIWLLEGVLKEIPPGTHDWKKFIRPSELESLLSHHGFEKIETKGFDIRGRNKKDRSLRVRLNENRSVMYIGKALRPT